MSLTKNVWKLGETIPVHVECSVKGGSLEVDKVFLAIIFNQYCIEINVFHTINKILSIFSLGHSASCSGVHLYDRHGQ